MIAVIFEFTPAQGRKQDYLESDRRGEAPKDSVEIHG